MKFGVLGIEQLHSFTAAFKLNQQLFTAVGLPERLFFWMAQRVQTGRESVFKTFPNSSFGAK